MESAPSQSIVVRALGRLLGVTAPAEVLEGLRPLLPQGWVPVEASRHAVRPDRSWQVTGAGVDGEPFEATAEGTHLATTPSLEGVVRTLADDIELWTAEHAEGLIVVHAGVVAVNGRAIVLPGRSYSGKSTLVAALVQAGATYYSDEYAPFDATGRVHAYPRAPRQRPDSPALNWPAPATGQQEPIEVALVAALTYDAVAGWQVETRPASAAVMALLANTVPALTRSTESLDTLAVACQGARTVSGTRGEAGKATKALLDLVYASKAP